ncbi:MAG: DUF1415 domain-containing protein [Planctomycetia bacterium]|nr:DUF1415 domain-containing protein [Planctomycetia bacterium]
MTAVTDARRLEICLRTSEEETRMEAVEHQVRQWLEQVVIGLNLCPFAGTPYRNGQIRISVSQAATEETLLAHLQSELELIDGTPVATVETTLLVISGMLADFDAYNQFLAEVETLLRQGGWEGRYQVASFHPRYRFRGTKEDDACNLTNRSPWPILHVIREASIDKALSDHSEPEAIPERNIRKMRSLSPEERREYFPWLLKAP